MKGDNTIMQLLPGILHAKSLSKSHGTDWNFLSLRITQFPLLDAKHLPRNENNFLWNYDLGS